MSPSPAANSSPARVVRRSLAVAAIVVGAGLGVGCGGQNPFEAGATATSVDASILDGGAVVDNDFIPEEQDLSSCVSTLPRPGCGSSARGGWRQYLTMGVLMAGLAFVGWRIARGVRARDAVVNATPDE